jgi:hypothetical protein
MKTNLLATLHFNSNKLQELVKGSAFTDATLSLASGVSMRMIREMCVNPFVKPSALEVAAIAESLQIRMDALIVNQSGEAIGAIYNPEMAAIEGMPAFARQRLRRAERQRLGLCIDCGGAPLKTKYRCEGCARRTAESQKMRRLRQIDRETK